MLKFGLGRFYIPRGHRLDAERVYLQPPRYRDWHAWAGLRARSREFLAPWEPSWASDALTHAAYRRAMRQSALEWHTDASYGFHIFRRADHAFLGGLALRHVRRGVAQAASLGYWVGAEFANQGFMGEAVGALVPFAFDRLGLHRVEAACLPRNEASRRLLLKQGFKDEGLARAYLRINGAWEDHVLFAMLAEDRRG